MVFSKNVITHPFANYQLISLSFRNNSLFDGDVSGLVSHLVCFLGKVLTVMFIVLVLIDGTLHLSGVAPILVFQLLP